ncbi:hypothetical protein O3P69_010449 [Scylla paramamosain]|uniref:Uncharacterized protein n=1 Tax=Scylla paramamosain TaxID=85552 RepID=A0AAW0TVW4_SCYPA
MTGEDGSSVGCGFLKSHQYGAAKMTNPRRLADPLDSRPDSVPSQVSVCRAVPPLSMLLVPDEAPYPRPALPGPPLTREHAFGRRVTVQQRLRSGGSVAAAAGVGRSLALAGVVALPTGHTRRQPQPLSQRGTALLYQLCRLVFDIIVLTPEYSFVVPQVSRLS